MLQECYAIINDYVKVKFYRTNIRLAILMVPCVGKKEKRKKKNEKRKTLIVGWDA